MRETMPDGAAARRMEIRGTRTGKALVLAAAAASGIGGAGGGGGGGGMGGASIMLGVAGWACSAAAQTAGSAASAPATADAVQEASAELWWQGMLWSKRVLSETVAGPVWRVETGPGRRLLQLPIRFRAGDEARTFDRAPLEPVGSRFIGWSLPGGATDPTPIATIPPGPTDAELRQLPELLDTLNRVDTALDPYAAGPAAAPAAGPDAGLALLGSTVPDGAPRLTRAVTIAPLAGEGSGDADAPADPNPAGQNNDADEEEYEGGVLRWELDRSINGAVLEGGESLYALYLDPDRLRDLEPAPPERLTRNPEESSRDFAFRERAQTVAYREQLTAYRDLRVAVRDVPNRFAMPLPDVVWAVFEVNAFGGDWIIRDTPGGDWRMSFEALATLQQLASGRGGGGSGPGAWADTELAELATLQRLAGEPHPWTQRMVAEAMARSGYLGRIAENGPGYAVADRLLQSDDELARNRTVYALAAQRPTTAGITALLSSAAARGGDPAVAYAALRSRLAGVWEPAAGVEAADGMRRAVEIINQALADPAAVAADRVVKIALATTPETPENREALVNAVRFSGLPAARLDGVLVGVLAEAEAYPAVVGGWLDRQLLGSPDPAVVSRTLELLDWADEPAPAVGALTRGLQGLLFGAPAEAEAADPPIVMSAPVPIVSPNHAIFRILNAGDADRRQRGWSALRHFELSGSGGAEGSGGWGGAGSESAASGQAEALSTIVSAGLGQTPTPPSLVPFLVQQEESPALDGALLEVLRRGDDAAAGQAARALRGSGRDVAGALAELSPAERAAVVGRVYERLSGQSQPVSGLVASSGLGVELTRWFAQRWTDDGLPTAAAWGREAGEGERGREALLSVAAEPDPTSGGGALAALAALAGADREVQLTMIERFQDKRTTLGREDLAAEWSDAARDIYTQRLESAAGEYVLSMNVAADAAVFEDPAVDTPVQETTLLRLKLFADGRSVRLSTGTPDLTVPDDAFALRVLEPGQLRDLQVESLARLPLNEVEGPLDLRPTGDGVWRGALRLPDGRGFELVMTRRE